MPTSINGPPPAIFLFNRHSPFLMLKPNVLYQLNGPKLSVPNHSDRAEIGRLILTPVGNHQFLTRLLASVDHSLAIFDAGCHRFLAEHMFAGLRCPNCIVRVHIVRKKLCRRHRCPCYWRWSHSFHNYEDILFGHAVVAATFSFITMAADQGGNFSVVRILFPAWTVRGKCVPALRCSS